MHLGSQVLDWMDAEVCPVRHWWGAGDSLRCKCPGYSEIPGRSRKEYSTPAFLLHQVVVEREGEEGATNDVTRNSRHLYKAWQAWQLEQPFSAPDFISPTVLNIRPFTGEHTARLSNRNPMTPTAHRIIVTALPRCTGNRLYYHRFPLHRGNDSFNPSQTPSIPLLHMRHQERRRSTRRFYCGQSLTHLRGTTGTAREGA
jgi:hypothetical protein